MCVCEGGYIEKCLGLVVQYGQLKFCTGWSHREVVVWRWRGVDTANAVKWSPARSRGLGGGEEG